jgi:hypothetical protein
LTEVVDIIQGFYANMGGIAIDTSGKQFLLNQYWNQRWVLTAGGIEMVAELAPELLAVITPQIFDKSKSSAMGKTIVCLQAFWFMIQCVSRLTHSLPLSLLELKSMREFIYQMLMEVVQRLSTLYLWFHNVWAMVAQAA